MTDSGTVRNSTINHYKDCSVDTVIELEDGKKIVYSHVAPIPNGHIITMTGADVTMAEAMLALHRNYFLMNGGQLVCVTPNGPAKIEHYFDPNERVLQVVEIFDEDTGVTYKERY